MGRDPGLNIGPLWAAVVMALGPTTAAAWTGGNVQVYRHTSNCRSVHWEYIHQVSCEVAQCVRDTKQQDKAGM